SSPTARFFARSEKAPARAPSSPTISHPAGEATAGAPSVDVPESSPVATGSALVAPPPLGPQPAPPSSAPPRHVRSAPAAPGRPGAAASGGGGARPHQERAPGRDAGRGAEKRRGQPPLRGGSPCPFPRPRSASRARLVERLSRGDARRPLRHRGLVQPSPLSR